MMRTKMEKMMRKRRKMKKMTKKTMARMRRKKIKDVMTSGSERLWFAIRPHWMVLFHIIYFANI